MKLRRILSIMLVVLVVTLVPTVTLGYDYTALGDSISYGVGASEPVGVNGYVGKFAAGIQAQMPGNIVNLSNSSIGGQTSTGLLQSIRFDPATRKLIRNAETISISIGGNNLLRALNRTTYTFDQQAAEKGVAQFWIDWPQIVGAIKWLNPDAQIYVITVYNPFSVDPLIRAYNPNFTNLYTLGEQYIPLINKPINSLGIISKYGHTVQNYKVVDVYSAFNGKAHLLTNIMPPTLDVHPNDAGHSVIAGMHLSVFQP